jgi:hypothetical protein
MAIQQTFDCCAGRLEIYDKKTCKRLEPDLKPSISLVEDVGDDVSGPIWLKGGVKLVSADGTVYEKRNRVTLCRCGGSLNKPFCDGSHAPMGFKAE